MGGKQYLDKDGQPVVSAKRCGHGVLADDRGNTACEECAEIKATESFVLGISSGWEEVAAHLMQESGRAFVEGKDDLALAMRQIAGNLKPLIKEKRARFEKIRDERKAMTPK